MANRNMLLMCGNIIVMSINFEDGVFDVLNEKLLPFRMKNALQTYVIDENASVKYNTTQALRVARANESAVVSWLANRTLLLSRKNAKKLYNAFSIADQKQDEYTRAKLALICRACSVLDNYWVKLDGDSITWENANLRHISLNEVVAQIALHGTSLTIQGSIVNSPEFLTNGASAKCWRRYPDGKLWLHKAGDNGKFEAKVEIAVSNILDRCNVNHCHYEAADDDGLFVSACPVMTDDNISIVDGDNFVGYCNRSGLDVESEIKRLDADSYYKMLIVDYLIANRDRHTQNWGFYYNPNTTELLKMHPLFDHNNAFGIECMQDENYKSHFGDKSLKENALNAMRHCDFHFTKDITKDLFVTQRQYDCFMHRAEQLGVETKKQSISGMLKNAGG